MATDKSRSVVFLAPTLELHGGTLIMATYAEALLKAGYRVSVIAPAKGDGRLLNTQVERRTYRPLNIRFLDTLLLQRPYWRAIEARLTRADFYIPIYTPLVWPLARLKSRGRLSGQIILIGQEAFEMPIIGPANRWLLTRPVVQAALGQIIAVSAPIAERYQALVGANKVTLIPNGVDRSLFRPRDEKRRRELLFVGRPNAPKGYPAFRTLAAEIRERYPDVTARLIAPDIPEQTDGPVTWQPFTDRQALAKAYNRALIYVCASTGESFGLPALEAMASGTPVVTTDTVGSRQYARDGENCLVVPVADQAALTAAVSRFIDDPKLAERLAAGGLKTARQYDQVASAQRFVALLDRL